jgi:hypothetical protein
VTAEELHARWTLRVYMSALFNDARALDPQEWTIFAGVSTYLRAPRIDKNIRDKARAERLGIKTRYFLRLSKNPVRVSEERPTGRTMKSFFWFDVPRVFEEAYDPRSIRLVPVHDFKRKADLVWDDIEELTTCGFPYAPEVAALDQPTRNRVYNKKLLDILPPATDVASTGFFDTGWSFRAAASIGATYAMATRGAPYYAKYRTPDRASERRFDFDHLSDDYLRLNYRPLELQRGIVHLFLRLGVVEILVALFRDNAGRLGYEGLLGKGLTSYGNLFVLIQEHLRRLKPSRTKPRAEAWFIYPSDGTSGPPSWTTERQDVAQGLGLHVLEQVIEPRCMVQSIRGLSCQQIDPDQQSWGHRRWMRELVRLRFADPWVSFWKNAYVEMGYSPIREKLFLQELREKETKATGPLKDRLRQFIRDAENDPTFYMMRRGRGYGVDRRLIGSDDSYVYIYDNTHKLLTRLPMFAFWAEMNIAQISEVIYNSTKGIIPIAKALAFGGLAVAGGAIVGTKVLIAGFRQYVWGRVRGAVIDQLLKVQFEKLMDRVLLRMLNEVLSCFPVTPSSSRPYAFIKGFVQGYSHDAFVALFQRWDSFVKLEPAAFQAIKLLMKIEAALQYVNEKVSLLKDVVTFQVAQLLMDRFVKVFVEAATGLAAVVNTLHFLDYERAKPLLEAYADMTSGKVLTKHEWDRIRHRQLLEVLKQYQHAIRFDRIDLKAVYQALDQHLPVLKRAVRIAGATLILELASGGALLSMVWFALALAGRAIWSTPGKVIGGNLVGGLALATAVSSDFRKVVKEAIVDLGELTRVSQIVAFALGTPERMERFGQLLGILIGGFTLNKHVFGKESGWLKRWTTEKSYSSFVTKHFVRDQLSVSPLIPTIKLLLFNYVFLIEKVIAETRKAWSDLEEEVEIILIGDQLDQDVFGPNQELTLVKIVEIIVAVDRLLTAWLVKLAEIPGLTQEIEKLVDTVASTAPEKVPTIQQVREEQLPEGWKREAVMFVMLSHLHVAVRYLADAIREMFSPVNPGAATPVSVADFLSMLGFQLDEDEVDRLLDRDFDEMVPEQSPSAVLTGP